jgi:hypothetical protein
VLKDSNKTKTSKGKRVNLFTWVYLSVSPNSISIYYVLKAECELVGFVIGRGSLVCLHPVQNGGHSGTTVFLGIKSNITFLFVCGAGD